MEAGEIIVAIGAYVGSKDVVSKLLGPTADYLGGTLKDWTERRVNNIGKIFENAHRKASKKLDEPGAVPPKVLKEILDNGSFADDLFASEYFGGVLASSRSDEPRDDRGAAIAALVAGLTTYQLRSHFFFYSLIKHIHNGSEFTATTTDGRSALEIFIPANSYISAMEFSDKERQNLTPLLDHVMFGLVKEGLIAERYNYGPLDYVKKHFAEATTSGIILQPSPLGIELFHWAHGMGDLPVAEFLKKDVVFNSDIVIQTTPGFQATKSKSKTSLATSDDTEQL